MSIETKQAKTLKVLEKVYSTWHLNYFFLCNSHTKIFFFEIKIKEKQMIFKIILWIVYKVS